MMSNITRVNLVWYHLKISMGMATIYILLISFLWTAQAQYLKFPDGFKIGVATASYQVEGAWNESGKGENIWDHLVHEHPDWIADRTNGDIACDSYHKIDEDVKNLEWLGVDFYRFSLSWSRILPTGYVNQVNEDGVRYYNNLIDAMLARGIQLVVTLYHWDLPQPLQEAGGWPNPLIADFFVDYARLAFKLFGDKVKWWITFNEPNEVCNSGYGDGVDAPAYTSNGIASYMCGKTILVAHGKAYKIYHDWFYKKQQGKVGITINSNWFEHATNSTEDVEAAERGMQMMLGWWAHPIYSKSGDYPTVMKERISKMSREEDFARSRLIPFTAEEVQIIRGSHDFFGLNHYTSKLVSHNTSSVHWKIPSYEKDVGVHIYFDPTWPSSSSSWLKSVPWGLRKLLNWIKREYGNPEVIITENGWADKGQLNDDGRIDYYRGYMNEMLKAVHIDGCNVTGYTAWSLMDNFEWRDGYTDRFGLFYTNITDPNRPRTAKSSAYYFKKVIQNRAVVGPDYDDPVVVKSIRE